MLEPMQVSRLSGKTSICSSTLQLVIISCTVNMNLTETALMQQQGLGFRGFRARDKVRRDSITEQSKQTDTSEQDD